MRKGHLSLGLVFGLLVFVATTFADDRTDASPKPPMGWMFRGQCSELDHKLVNSTAKFLKESGMLKAGYNTIILNECWMGEREDGKLTPKDAIGDIKTLNSELKSNGFTLGLTLLTCDQLGATSGSGSDLSKDIDTLMSWKIDYVRVTSCDASDSDDVIEDKTFNEANLEIIKKKASSSNPILHCDLSDKKNVFKYTKTDCNVWSETDDPFVKFDTWTSKIDSLVKANFTSYSGKGHWDMVSTLDVSPLVFERSLTERTSQFALWSSLGGPLILSGDLVKTKASPDLSTETQDRIKQVYNNPAAIAIAQDASRLRASRILQNETAQTEVWSRPLSDRSFVVLYLNRGSKASYIGTSFDLVLSSSYPDHEAASAKMDWTSHLTASLRASLNGESAKTVERFYQVTPVSPTTVGKNDTLTLFSVDSFEVAVDPHGSAMFIFSLSSKDAVEPRAGNLNSRPLTKFLYIVSFCLFFVIIGATLSFVLNKAPATDSSHSNLKI